jgi:hypothetical protein
MLLPNDIKPELSVFYYAALVLKEIQSSENREIIMLFRSIKDKYDISLRVFAYCLDWLYLIEAAKVDEEGQIMLCT